MAHVVLVDGCAVVEDVDAFVECDLELDRDLAVEARQGCYLIVVNQIAAQFAVGAVVVVALAVQHRPSFESPGGDDEGYCDDDDSSSLDDERCDGAAFEAEVA